MKFSTKEDIAVPIEEVFAVISDFGKMERAALRRGADLTRTDTLTDPAPGMAWSTRFDFRGKQRHVQTELTGFTPPEWMTLRSSVSGLDGVTEIELLRLSPRQTRIAVAVELRPQTLSARVFLQTLRLAKAKLSNKFKSGVARFAREMEAGTFRG
ncbi:MAG: SRPBCC family protein [Rhodobacteraceae bacterium]|nr:SRPBCC family protein [Paracoccaceae bacterium]